MIQSQLHFSLITVLIPNKDGYKNEYPITFQNVRLNDNCICYTISCGLCNNGLSYS